MPATAIIRNTSGALLAERRARFQDQMLAASKGAMQIFTVYLGRRVGLYDALAHGEALTSTQLAQRTGCYERYVREWLEQQTVAGVLEVLDEAADARTRRYRLPEAHREVLVDTDSQDFMGGLPMIVLGAAEPLEALIEDFRLGKGVPYEAYGTQLRQGQALMNRPIFMNQLGREWLPSIPDIHARLCAKGARVADIGCGVGWSSIGIAQSYPNAQVDGFDLDEASVIEAQAHAKDQGMDARVAFHLRDASDPDVEGPYDLVCAFECLHDMGRPVEALRVMKRLAGPDGSVLIMDERAGHRFSAEGNEIEWLLYGFSVLHCLPVGIADGGHCGCGGTGTVMRTETLEGYAREAGFRRVEVLPIENLFFRFYRLYP